MLKEDNRAIFTTSAHAQRAVDYLNQSCSRNRKPRPPEGGLQVSVLLLVVLMMVMMVMHLLIIIMLLLMLL